MAKNMTEYELAVRIAGKVDKTFNTSLNKADRSLKDIVAGWDADFSQMDAGYDRIMDVGAMAFNAIAASAVAATAAITTAGIAAANVGIEFESAFAGVKKTVNASEEEFALLKQDILDMSTEIPSTAAEIAAVMESAGQLGIEKEALTDFTEVMVNLGVSTNMSAEEAASALAKFANITGMDSSSYENLGSVIVDLGNNFATTEADIVEMATRLAATGELAGLSEAQIAALATAMSSVGIEAEAGGSAMSKLLKNVQVAVETGGEALKDYASVAGMTVNEFSSAFKKDAVVALSEFISGLNDTERNGASAIVLLEDMGLTEVRLSNTILSLANSHEVMSNAIETANKAWEENNALAEEASKRYETTESRITILKNAFTELGIGVFDEMDEPFKEGIEWLTNGVKEFTDYATGPNGISKWADELEEELQVVIKKAKAFSESVEEFTEPLVDAGKWLIKNPDFLSRGFVALGSAFASYKIATTVEDLVSGIVTLGSSPVMLGVVGLTAAVGSVAAMAYESKRNFQELVDLRLDKAFGDVALSLEDIRDVADYLVEDGSLASLREALAEFDELSGIQAIIEKATKDLKKSNWKVSIGMELTGEEQEEYQKSIDEFVKGCNDYVLQQNYAVGLAFEVLSDESMSESDIGTKISQFYNEQQAELQGLGINLATAVNEAFADKILDSQEITEIADIQAKMAEIQNKIADADFEANLISISKEYDFTNLDADSFQALQTELTERLEEATVQYAQARDQLLANAVLMHNEGALTDVEFDTHVNEIWTDYLNKVSVKQTEVAEVLLSGIDNTMITDMLQDMAGAPEESVKKWMDVELMYSWKETPGMMWEQMLRDVPSIDVEATATAVEGLLSNMQGITNLIEASENYYISRNMPVPEHITEFNQNLADITLLTNEEAVKEAAVGAVIRENSDYSAIIDMLEEKALERGEAAGTYIPEGIARGMDANYSVVTERMNQIVEKVSEQAASIEIVKFSVATEPFTTFPKSFQNMADPLGLLNNIPAEKQDIIATENSTYTDNNYNTNVIVEVPELPEIKNLESEPFTTFPKSFGISDPLGLLKHLPGHKDGGIFDVPHIAAFAEAGPEAAIPLDGSANAINLWKRTGQLLGMKSVLDDVDIETSVSTPHIEYNPQLNFYGGTPDRKDLESAMKISQEEFESMLEKWFKNKARFAF